MHTATHGALVLTLFEVAFGNEISSLPSLYLFDTNIFWSGTDRNGETKCVSLVMSSVRKTSLGIQRANFFASLSMAAITNHVRSTRGGNVFTAVCDSVQGNIGRGLVYILYRGR